MQVRGQPGAVIDKLDDPAFGNTGAQFFTKGGDSGIWSAMVNNNERGRCALSERYRNRGLSFINAATGVYRGIDGDFIIQNPLDGPLRQNIHLFV